MKQEKIDRIAERYSSLDAGPPEPRDIVVAEQQESMARLIRADAEKHPDRYRIKGRQERAKVLDDKAPIMRTITRSMPKVGRNDPCPCGTGRKYKACHMKFVEPTR